MCGSYREKIRELWDRLHIPEEDREAVVEHMTMSRKRNMEAVCRHLKTTHSHFFKLNDLVLGFRLTEFVSC